VSEYAEGKREHREEGHHREHGGHRDTHGETTETQVVLDLAPRFVDFGLASVAPVAVVAITSFSLPPQSPGYGSEEDNQEFSEQTAFQKS